jgi:co-chaperonin GroES (HSP10)
MPRKKKSIQEQIAELAQREYQETGRRFIPLYPWILVRILPKEAWSASGNLILPSSQNKVLYEGIVLETYQPVTQPFRTYTGVEGEETVTCPVVPGDQIAFPHWDGFPVPFLDERTHRCIREVVPDAKGGVPFKIEAEDTTTEQKLTTWLTDLVDNNLEYAAQLAKELMDDFTIIPTGQKPKFQTVG